MKKNLNRILCAACAAFVLWGVLSFADIVADNTHANAEHSDWNLFTVAFQK